MVHKRNGEYITPKDEWETPGWLFDQLDQEYAFDCDAAARKENSKCSRYFEDALEQKEWCMPAKSFFMNPPYSAGKIDAFMKKAYEESLKGALVVCLVPAATDTWWWHNYAMKAQEIRFIRGRVQFVGKDENGNPMKNSPTFSSCVVVFNQDYYRTHIVLTPKMPRIGATIEKPPRKKKSEQMKQEKKDAC